MVELRWVLPEHTTTDKPRLQYRQCGQWPSAWGEWQDVPTVVVPNEPKPAPTVANVFGVAPSFRCDEAMRGRPRCGFQCPICEGDENDIEAERTAGVRGPDHETFSQPAKDNADD